MCNILKLRERTIKVLIPPIWSICDGNEIVDATYNGRREKIHLSFVLSLADDHVYTESFILLSETLES